MKSLHRDVIVAKELGTSLVFVKQVLSGVRGKRGSVLQDKILKASYGADGIIDRAKTEIVQYCEGVNKQASAEL